MPAMIRSACLTGYTEVAREHGIDPLQQLRTVGLNPRCLDDPDIKILIEAGGRLLENSAQAAAAEDFALCMAESRRLSNLGPLALLLREEPNLRKVLEAMQNFMHLHNEALLLLLDESNGVAVIREEYAGLISGSIRQARELSIGVTYRLLSTLLGSGWAPLAVCFMHTPPQDDSTHRRVFGTTPVQFNSKLDGIVCRSSDLDRPLPNADSVTAIYIEQYLESLRQQSDAAPVTRVEHLIWTLLPTGRCSVEQVAFHLGIDRRTLHRHLLRDGESFSAVFERVRSAQALRHLQNPRRSLAEIARLLGFSALSAFSRWFKQQHGCSPSLWRKNSLPLT